MLKELLAAVVIATALAGCASDPARYDKPGFTTVPTGRTLWVFRSDSPELAAFKANEEPARPVVRAGAGPAGMTLKAPDMTTIDDYLAARAALASTAPMDARPSPPPADTGEYAPPVAQGAYAPPPSQKQNPPAEQQDGWYVTHPR